MLQRLLRITLAVAVLAGLTSATAGVVVYEKDAKKIEIGARIQVQYAYEDPDGQEATDRVFFRRLRPYVAGTITESWMGKIEFDFGEAEDNNELSVKDAYLRYSGFDAGKLTIGNVKPGFSRQFLTSSKYQQLVERAFVGDHNFGTPDRALGVKWDGGTEKKKLTYSLMAAGQHHDPDAAQMDFDSPAVDQSDWNQGLLFVGRVDFHPLGFVKFDRGDFDRSEPRFNVSVAAFNWNNDDDNNTFTSPTTGVGTSPTKADLDQAGGVELSAGFRGRGVSLDVELQTINGETIDPTFTGGLYVAGETDLDKLSFNGGYMVVRDRFEIALAYESLDADGYTDAWTRGSLGLNYFVNKHNLKFQLAYSQDENVDGVTGADADMIQLQGQLVF